MTINSRAHFYGFRNWYRAASEEQREAFRVELAADEARRAAYGDGPGPIARIWATCDAIFAGGREPTGPILRERLPDLNPGTIKMQLAAWRKSHREAAAMKIAAE